MKKYIFAILLFFTFLAIGQTKKKKSKLSAIKLPSAVKLPTSLPSVPKLSESDISAGLKEALNIGTDKTVAKLSVLDGYLSNALLKILLPAEVSAKVESLKAVVGQDNYNKFLQTYEADLITSLNRAAEDAATTAAPIIKDAILGMTINDAKNILIGTDSAATNYLRGKSFNNLIGAYTPKINASLDKPLVMSQSTNQIYTTFVSNYNKMFDNSITSSLISGYNMFASKKVERMPDTSLGEYVTRRALSGLFLKIKDEEKVIRTDLNARTTSILQKVFDKKNWPF